MQINLKEFTISLVVMSALLAIQASNISILISLPLHHISGPRTSWESGLDILPGALLAVNDFNNDSTLIPGHNLQLIINDDTEIVQNFIDNAFHQKHLNIVGVSGILDPKTISILLPLVKHRGVLLSAITHKDMPHISDEHSGTFLSLPSPSSMVNALLTFTRAMNWQRIGLITEFKDEYFFKLAETLLQKVNTYTDITILPYFAELFHIRSALHEIVKLNTKIVFVSINARRALHLLCVVHEKGLVWPEYAWIFHSFQVEDLLNQQSVCNIENAIEGIFLIDSQPALKSNPFQRRFNTFSDYQHLYSLSGIALKYNTTLSRFKLSSYAGLLYCLVWNMAIASNKSCHQSMNCSQQREGLATTEKLLGCHQHHNEQIFKISHIRELQQVLISTMHYNSSHITLSSFNEDELEGAPKGQLLLMTQHPPFGYTLLLSLQIALTTIFVTLTLLLYIYFHNEPEIKATSFTLSLLTFAGCYLNLVYLSLLLYTNHIQYSINILRDNIICVSLQWLSASGVSLSLMLATLIVKMSRIYHIFYSDKLHSLGCHCSDLSLAFYVLLILIPGIILNIIWAVVDRFQVDFEYKVQGGYIYLEKFCRSRHQALLYGVVTIYLLAQIVALAIVAILTRKVRLQNFKDTKKVNILLFFLSATIVVSLSYWLMLLTLNTKRYIATIPLHVGHLLGVIFIVSLLFVPKIFPPLWRHIKHIKKNALCDRQTTV